MAGAPVPAIPRAGSAVTADARRRRWCLTVVRYGSLPRTVLVLLVMFSGVSEAGWSVVRH